jgi:hypothetical protein
MIESVNRYGSLLWLTSDVTVANLVASGAMMQR